MKILAYETGGRPLEIRPAPRTRQWMDETGDRYAYRCLPLVMANQYGFELLAPEELQIFYAEGSGLDAITFKPKADWAMSHFGYGIVTFIIPYLFRTPAGIHLYIAGPANMGKVKLEALEGIYESDHAPQTFTMNWRFTAWNASALFREGEPICRIFPVKAGILENSMPKVIPFEKVPQSLREEHEKWSNSRREFNQGLAQGDPKFVEAKWQKDYVKAAKYK